MDENPTPPTQTSQNPTETPMLNSPQPLPSYPNPTNNTGELPSALALFGPSIEAFKLNLAKYLSVYGVIVVLGIVTGFISSANTTIDPTQTEVAAQLAVSGTALMLGLAMVAATLVLGPAITYIQLQSARGNKVSIGESLRVGSKFILRFIGLGLLLVLLITGGLVLFIVPGLIMIRRYFLSIYFLVDQDLGVLDSMKKSAALSKANSGAVWGVIGVSFVCGLPSLIPVVGRIISGVLGLLYSFAPAIRYLQILGESNNGQPASTPANDPIR